MPHGEATPESRSADMSPAVRGYHEKLYQELMALIRTLGCERLADIEAHHHTNTPEGLMVIAKDPGLSKRFVQLHHLTTLIEAIRRNPTDTSLIPEDFKREIEFTNRETELRRLLKDGFLGFSDIEWTFTLSDGSSAIDFTEEEKDEARQMLLDKLAEPDIAAFIERLKANPEEAKNWILVYRTRAKIRSSPAPNAPMSDISIRTLYDTLDADARSGAYRRKLIHRDGISDNDRYSNDIAEGEAEPWGEKSLAQGWRFVTKDIVTGTTNKKHADQTSILAEMANNLGFADGAWRRRTPQEVLYDLIVAYRATSTILLPDCYDRTEQRTTNPGGVLVVGNFTALGVYMFDPHRNFPGTLIGTALSR